MRYYRFGPFTLDAVAGKLTIYGEHLAVARKPLAILERLLLAQGGIVTRSELMRELWPDEPVSETTLCQHVYMLRDILRRHAPDQEFVVTVHKTGYRIAVQAQYPAQAAGTRASSLYLQGRFYLERRNEDGFLRAMRCFERVLAADPSDAPAIAGVGEAFALLGSFAFRRPHETFPRARAMLEKALERDPNLSAAYCSLGDVLLHYDWDHKAASAMYGRALAIDPHSVMARTNRAWSNLAAGRSDLALADVHEALGIQPDSPRLWTMLGVAQYFRGDYDAAETYLQSAADIDPANFLPRYYLCAVKGMRGDFDGVFDMVHAEVPNEFRQHMWSIEGFVHAKLGNSAEKERCINAIYAVAEPQYPSSYNVAMVHAGANDARAATAALELGLRHREPWMIFAAVQPYFLPLRRDPRFIALTRRVGPFDAHAPQRAQPA
ncbi:MAG TPA: winged helix-turn-helix domain-containing protein [Candidatus Baltobacteraceae bacterium]|jgi:DNA-binding winged helix-turn-helix (wHTH) protein|nr:winged helix-turn-helix domain-containing protein [Candidatus Baltobacteraceae bacterium]